MITLLNKLIHFFFNDTATTEIYNLSLHEALPISRSCRSLVRPFTLWKAQSLVEAQPRPEDRKSTRLKSSHVSISYAVFCFKKKKYIESNDELPRQKNQNIKKTISKHKQ